MLSGIFLRPRTLKGWQLSVTSQQKSWSSAHVQKVWVASVDSSDQLWQKWGRGNRKRNKE